MCVLKSKQKVPDSLFVFVKHSRMTNAPTFSATANATRGLARTGNLCVILSWALSMTAFIGLVIMWSGPAVQVPSACVPDAEDASM